MRCFIVQTLQDHDGDIAFRRCQPPLVKERFNDVRQMALSNIKADLHVGHAREQATQLDHQENDTANKCYGGNGLKQQVGIIEMPVLAKILNHVSDEEQRADGL